jgi:LacI family transcriptional regulator
MAKRVRLKELAEELGLSRTAVSRALNDYPDVSEETRARVVAAAKRLGYMPDMMARKLATGRTGAIGMIFEPNENLAVNPNLAELILGVTAWCAGRRMMFSLGGSTEGEGLEAFRNVVAARQVDGLIVGAPKREDARVRFLAEQRFPFIVHGRTRCELPHAWLDIDNEGGFRAATRLLLDFGHARIALLNGPADANYAADRASGYRAALAERGLEADERLILPAPMTQENGYANTVRALAESPRPTAFLCADFMLWLGCQRALREAGLEIPRDVSVIAHDDVLPTMTADGMQPSLTTTRSPIRAAGERMAALLRELIDGRPAEEVQELWEVELIVRASTAPPPKAR